jgi:hypothetical protein
LTSQVTNHHESLVVVRPDDVGGMICDPATLLIGICGLSGQVPTTAELDKRVAPAHARLHARAASSADWSDSAYAMLV